MAWKEVDASQNAQASQQDIPSGTWKEVSSGSSNGSDQRPQNYWSNLPIPTRESFQPTPEQIKAMTLSAAPAGGLISPLLRGAEALPGIGNSLSAMRAGLAENHPFINKLMQLGGTGAEGSAIGAALNPEDRTKGAMMGFGLGAGGRALGEAVPATYNAVNNVYKTAGQKYGEVPSAPNLPQPPTLPKLALPENKPIPTMAEHMPQAPQAGNDLLEKLGQGSANKEEGATKLASMIKEKHDQRSEEAGQFFNHVFDRAGKDKLYEHVEPLISTAMDKEMSMMNRLEGINVKPLYESFKNNPTIENGHWLQSELGTVVGDLERNTAKTPADRATIKNINNVRDTLKNDIIDSLKRRDSKSNETLAPKYEKGIELHKQNVAPFRSTPELRDITVKGTETPKNIENIFNTPTNIIKKGESTTGPINKIISDLPPEAKDLILFNKVGASQHAGQHEKLLNALQSARNEGYSSYFNPHVEEAIKDIGQKSKNDIANKNMIETNHKMAMKARDEANKKAIDEAKSEHRRQIDEMKSAHKSAKTNAILEHKVATQKVNNRNALIKEAKKTRNFLNLGAAALLGGPTAVGAYHAKNKLFDE